jgi:uncharacterized protein (TIGR02266 family)
MSAPRPKILLVDDVDFILDTERDYLKRTPADVVCARSGAEALAMVHRERPQLVYLDATLPDLTGHEVCAQLKADPFLKLIPVILLVASAEELKTNHCAICGCDAVLAKPVERIAFLDAGYKYLFAIERREKRVACRLPVHGTLAGAPFECVSADLSLHGLYLQWRTPVAIGAAVEVSFTLPHENRPIHAQGRVAWVNQGFPRTNLSLPQGFGVHFPQVAASDLLRLTAFVEENEELRPEVRIAPATSTAFLNSPA